MNLIDKIADQAAVTDALLRFANGMDTDNAELIRSAFTADAVADFGPAADKVGIQFPLLEGQDAITQGLGGFAAGLDTSHSVTNVRVEFSDTDTASAYALVEAQHLPLGVRDRHMLMKNRYIIDARRDGDGWRISRMTIDNIWADGDITVITGG
jgi:hypothetical protein